MSSDSAPTKFGNPLPFSEPAWYDSRNGSPFYTPAHEKWRAVVRKFIDEEIIPNREKWEAAGRIPDSVYLRAGELGIISASMGWPECSPIKRPEGYDGLFSLITMDEVSRCASGGVVWGLIGGAGIGLPPVLHDGPEDMIQRVAIPVLMGQKKIALAVSEATAGSDVANLSTTAEECVVDGVESYKIVGLKKWITVGLFADYFTVAARTGDKGMGGISLILVEKSRPGVSVRAMECMGAQASGTAFVEFDDVIVPRTNYIGSITSLLRNFVTERLGIAVQATRFSRCLLTECIEYSRRRKAFGKTLDEQPVVRQKLAHMMREVEVTQAFIESLAYRLVAMERRGEDWFEGILRTGAEAALAKVQATRAFEYCAREAAMIHGGNAYVKGNRVEHLYRHVLSLSIPGGSEDVLVDAAARLALKGKL